MKILHISGARSWGGNEQQLVHAIQELNKVGVESFIFGVNSFELHQYALNNDIKFISCKDKKLNKVKNYFYLKTVVKKINPDLIHLHTSDSVTVYTVSDLLFNLKTPTVFSKKGISRKVSALSKYKYNYKNINKILCVSQVVLDHFKEVLKEKNHYKLCLVYDGVKVEEAIKKPVVNIRDEYNLSDNSILIGNVANHNGAKDLATFVKTLHVLVNDKNLKNVHFIQVGAFTRETIILKELVKEYQLENYITFTNFLEDASLLIPQFDVFLMTSKREGGPTSVLEAFYKKVPVVSTKVGVVSEAIENGVNGFVTNVGDYNSLAEKIELLYNNDSLMNSFKEVSYNKFLKMFTTEKLGINTFEVYKEVLGLSKDID